MAVAGQVVLVEVWLLLHRREALPRTISQLTLSVAFKQPGHTCGVGHWDKGLRLPRLSLVVQPFEVKEHCDSEINVGVLCCSIRRILWGFCKDEFRPILWSDLYILFESIQSHAPHTGFAKATLEQWALRRFPCVWPVSESIPHRYDLGPEVWTENMYQMERPLLSAGPSIWHWDFGWYWNEGSFDHYAEEQWKRRICDN